MTTAHLVACKAMLKANGTMRVALSGNCMNPLLCEGDIVLVREVDSLELGSICMHMRANGDMAVHRIVAIRDKTISLKGDKSNRYEEVDASFVLGAIESMMPQGSNNWYEMPSGTIIKRIAAAISRNVIHALPDSDIAFIAKAKRLKRRACRHILIFLNKRIRNKILSDLKEHPQPDSH